MGTATKRILFAINEQTGAMKSFGRFPSFEALVESFNFLLSGEDPVGWPDGWTAYMYVSCSRRFDHPEWYTPRPDGMEDSAWLPVAFDPFVDLPLAPGFETAQGDWVDGLATARDAWIIRSRTPSLAELLQANWRRPSPEDFRAFDLSPGAMVAELGDLMMVADRRDGKTDFQIHGVTPEGEIVFWRAEMNRWIDHS